MTADDTLASQARQAIGQITLRFYRADGGVLCEVAVDDPGEISPSYIERFTPLIIRELNTARVKQRNPALAKAGRAEPEEPYEPT